MMIIEDLRATNAASDCPCPSLESISAVRKRLLVLLAGNTATLRRWPHSNNNWGDWQDILKAIHLHFHRPDVSKWIRSDGMKLRDPEADDLVQAAILKTAEILENVMIRNAIANIANAFVSAERDPDGMTRLPGTIIVSICEQEIGNDF